MDALQNAVGRVVANQKIFNYTVQNVFNYVRPRGESVR